MVYSENMLFGHSFKKYLLNTYHILSSRDVAVNNIENIPDLLKFVFQKGSR